MSGWAYMLRCSDDSFYVGSTSYTEVETRVTEHNDAKYIGYTAARRPVVLVWAMHFDDLRDAHETERRIKGCSRAKKKALIANNEHLLKALSVRRVVRPTGLIPRHSKRELNAESQSTGARFALMSGATSSKQSNTHAPRTAAEAQAAKQRRPLIEAHTRHPDVRSRAQRRGAPKDD